MSASSFPTSETHGALEGRFGELIAWLDATPGSSPGRLRRHARPDGRTEDRDVSVLVVHPDRRVSAHVVSIPGHAPGLRSRLVLRQMEERRAGSVPTLRMLEWAGVLGDALTPSKAVTDILSAGGRLPDIRQEYALQSEIWRTVVGKVVARLGDERIKLFERAMAHTRNAWDYEPLFALDARSVSSLLGASSRYPFLVDAMGAQGVVFPGSLPDEPDAVLASFLPSPPPPATLRRFAGRREAVVGFALPALAELPHDWIPRADDVRGWSALAALADPVAVLRTISRRSARELCAGAGGRWAEYAATLSRAARLGGADSLSLAISARGVGDMAGAFAAQVVLPAALARRRDSGTLRLAADATARDILLSRGSATAMLERAARWHGARDATRAELRSAAPGGAFDISWPTHLPGWTDPRTGLAVVPLSTSRDLDDEGAGVADASGRHGLRHCVGGYAGRCADGLCRIVSIRAPDGARLSTAQIEFDPVMVCQHSGPGNRTPSSEATDTLVRYVGVLRNAGFPSPPAVPRPELPDALVRAGYDFREAGLLDRALDLWRPILPRGVRAVGTGEIGAAVARALEASRHD